MLAPICLFTYNRLEETRLTIDSLQKNILASKTDLYIFSDAAKNENSVPVVNRVREFIRTVNGFKSVTIFESEHNKGLANSIIDGVTKILDRHGKVIVLEDDLISHPYFLTFMNDALNFYEPDKTIQTVNGYSVLINNPGGEVYFQQRPFPWGWATWGSKWQKEIFDKQSIRKILNENGSVLKKFKANCGEDIARMLLNSLSNKNDSWYVRWTFDHYLNNRYSVFPSKSFIINIGHNTNGTHCKGINTYKSEFRSTHDSVSPEPFRVPSRQLTKEFLHYFKYSYKINYRLKMMKSQDGRKEVMNEIKSKLNLV